MKKLRSFCCALALAVGVASVSLARSTPNTKKWKIYSVPSLHFMVKSPPKWLVGEQGTQVMFMPDVKPEDRAIATIGRMPMFSTLDMTIRDEMAANPPPGHLTRTRVDLNGVKAIRLDGASMMTPGGRMVEYFIDSHGGRYHLMFQVPKEKMWSKYEPYFQAILESFQVTP